MHPKVLQMNHKDANPAVMLVKIPEEIAATEKCSKPLVQLVAKLAKFLLNLVMIVLYIAAIALQTEDNINQVLSALRKRRIFLFSTLISSSVVVLNHQAF
jgi:hypothetical protein